MAIFWLLPLAYMVIAVNTRFLQQPAPESYGYFIWDLLKRLAAIHSKHQFYFLFDRPYDSHIVFSTNSTPLVIGPVARHPVFWKWWYDVSVPLALRKIKADVFVSPDGICSLTTRVPQCLVPDLGFLHVPQFYTKGPRFFYKHYMPKFLKKAKVIATGSQFSKQNLITTYKVPDAKINVVYSGVKDMFGPISFEQQTSVKEQYTDGCEYFIYVGVIHPRNNLLNLLKAFSIFKKRQKSNMKLMLAGNLAWANGEFLELLKTYKYRSDVVLLQGLKEKERALVLAAAYAMVYPSFFEGFGGPVAEAMQCGVPVLTSKDSAMQELSEGAALYFDPNNVADMAEALMRMYKDETTREQLIEQGKYVVQKYTWEAAADALWHCIETAAKH